MPVFARLLLRWSGGRRFTGHLVATREEFRHVIQESAQGLTSEERAMITRVLDLQHLTAGHVATPLAKTVSVSAEMPVGKFLQLCHERGLTRFPVWKRDNAQQRIAGLVNVKSILYREEVDENAVVGQYLEPALYLQDQTRLEVALRQMQRTGQRLAIVLGPDRREIGVVSLQDVLKAIFGEVSL
jgi:putative hemolysin